MLSLQKINTYLHFGYSLPNVFPTWLDDCFNFRTPINSYSPKEAGKLLDLVFQDTVTRLNANGYCIIPISGGLDSRILLGCALKHFNTSQIKTFSFGINGLFDYEIGRKVSKYVGVEHTAIDLSKIPLSWGLLLQSVKASPWTYVPDSFFNRYCIYQTTSESDIILSGFMGDPLTGSHLKNTSSLSKAKSDFILSQCRSKKLRLTSPIFDALSAIPKTPTKSSLTHNELLDIGLRQAHCIAPIVTPLKRWTGWGGHLGRFEKTKAEALAPFVHPAWASYWLKAPEYSKKKQGLYKTMLKEAFPDLYSIPTKAHLGLPLHSNIRYASLRLFDKTLREIKRVSPAINLTTNRNLNYLDYDKAFRNNEDYAMLLNEAITYINSKEIMPWINLNNLQKEHNLYRSDLSETFWVIIGLALNLQNEQLKIKNK